MRHTCLYGEVDGVAGGEGHRHRAAAVHTHAVARDVIIDTAAAAAAGGGLVGYGVVHVLGGDLLFDSFLGGSRVFNSFLDGGLFSGFLRCFGGGGHFLRQDLKDLVLRGLFRGGRLLDGLPGRGFVDEQDLLRFRIRRFLRKSGRRGEGQQHAEDQRDADQFLIHGSFSFVSAQCTLLCRGK